MIKDINTKSNRELETIIKKAIVARKAVKKKMEDFFTKGWMLKSGKYRLDYAIDEAKKKVGQRKASKCKAVKSLDSEYSYAYYSCLARELYDNRFDIYTIYRKYCWSCKWTPEQAQARMVILKIKNGGKIHKE